MTKIIDDDYNETDMFMQAPQAPVRKPAQAPANPLKKYFRMPGLTVRLPSNGRFNTIDFQSDGTVEVLPLRAADELLLNSPDALMSGAALENVIRSCVPAVHDPENLPIPDMDVLLLAIRSASNGPTMEVEIDCEKCSEHSAFECELAGVLATAVDIPEHTEVRLSDDVTVSLRPHTMTTQTKVLNSAFAEQRKAQSLALDENMPEEAKQTEMNAIYQRIARLEIEITAEAVLKVSTPDGDVTDPIFIREFLSETTKEWVKKIRSCIDTLNTSMDKSISVQCPSCQHVQKTEISFDPSSFFEQGSSD